MIHIIDNIYMDSDGDSFIIGKKMNYVDKKTGKPIFKTIGYYTSIDSVLQALLYKSDFEICRKTGEDIVELKDALNSMRESRQEIRNIVSKALG